MFKGILGSIFGSSSNETNPSNPVALSKKLNASLLHQAAINPNINWLGSQNQSATQILQQQAMSAARSQQQAASGILLTGQANNILISNNQMLYYGHTNEDIASYNKIGIDLLAHTINFKILNNSININSDVLPQSAKDMFEDLFVTRNVMWFNNIKEATYASKIMFEQSIPAMIIIKKLSIRVQVFEIAGLQVQNKEDLITLKLCL